MIARDAPTNISANNILAVKVTDIAENKSGVLDITLGLGDAAETKGRAIHARITMYSAARLKLAIGQNVYAIIKSVTVDGYPTGLMC